MKRRIRILDLDNTIANDAWRIKYIDWSKKNLDERYHEYHLKSIHDEPGNEGLFCNLPPNTDIVIFTARPVQHSGITLAWLRSQGIQPLHVLTRNAGDHSPSVVLKEKQLDWLLNFYGVSIGDILDAYDDRPDVCEMFMRRGILAHCRPLHSLCAMTPPITPPSAADVLQTMADTYRERNSVYADNYKMIGPMVKILFPNGVPPELVVTDHWHLFELLLVKLARFASTSLNHVDSIHDAAIYGAMIEAILTAPAAKAA